MHRILLVCTLALLQWGITVEASGQGDDEGHQVSGYVLDAASGEALIGATVWCASIKAGVSSNTYGYYSLQLPIGQQQVTVSFIGFQSQSFELDLKEDLKMDVELASGVAIQEAVVTGEVLTALKIKCRCPKWKSPWTKCADCQRLVEKLICSKVYN